MKHYLAAVFFGLLLGFFLSFIGFSDFGEVHRMFTFADPRLFLTFAGALGLTIAGFAIIKGRDAVAPKPIHKGTVLGALLFGAGWAITGACPTIPLVQMGEGHLPALFTVGGIAAGMKLWEVIQARYLHWDVGSCES